MSLHANRLRPLRPGPLRTAGARRVWLDPAAAAPGDPAQLGETIAALLANRGAGRLLKRDGRSWVRLVELDGQKWIVKGYTIGAAKAAVQRWVRRTPGWREHRGAATLAGRGIRCVVPVAMVTPDPAGEADEVLILRAIDGVTLGQWIATGEAATPIAPAVFGRVGSQIRQMVEAGVINRDHKASNLILDAAARRGEAPPWIIDAGGLRRYRGRAHLDRVLGLLERTCRDAGPISDAGWAACVAAATGAEQREGQSR